MSETPAPVRRGGSKRVIGAIVLAAVVPVACGGSSDDDAAASVSEAETAGSSAAPVSPADAAAAPVEDASSAAGGASIVVDGVEYSLSVADDIAVGGTGAFFPTRCEPDVFGSGLFSVVATAVDDTGARAEPAVTLSLVLPHDGAGSADAPPELGLSVEGEGASALDYVLATDDGLAGVAGPPLEGELGTWSVDGNRITGEVTVFESDHERDFTTATFDITCPTP